MKNRKNARAYNPSLFSTFQYGIYAVSWTEFRNWSLATDLALGNFTIGGANAIVYGLALGALYKK